MAQRWNSGEEGRPPVIYDMYQPPRWYQRPGMILALGVLVSVSLYLVGHYLDLGF